MNKWNFHLSESKTQYDSYKYKLTSPISYNRRKAYRYEVHNKVYDLRSNQYNKFIYKVLLDPMDWIKFRNHSWEDSLHDLGLYSEIISHLEGVTTFNGFHAIDLDEGLDLNLVKDENSSFSLRVDWFLNTEYRPAKNELYLVIFNAPELR